MEDQNKLCDFHGVKNCNSRLCARDFIPKHGKTEWSRDQVKALLDEQRLICIAKYAHHTDLHPEDIYNIPYPSEFKDCDTLVKIK